MFGSNFPGDSMSFEPALNFLLRPQLQTPVPDGWDQDGIEEDVPRPHVPVAWQIIQDDSPYDLGLED